MSKTLHATDHRGSHDRGYYSGSHSRIIIRILVEVAITLEGDASEAGISAVRTEALRIAELDCASLAEPRDEIGYMRGCLALSQIRAVDAYFEEHLGERILREDLSVITRLSARYFTVQFKRGCGLSPHAHLMQCRTVRAKSPVLTTNEPLAQVAAACGFIDRAHLSELFRRQMGITPRAWRRELARHLKSLPAA